MTDTTDDERTLSRRERNKLEKRRRLFDAASDLFVRHGYSAVTTQQIADAADVGTGTLFRYFPTKADLFVEVMNRKVSDGIRRGIAAAESGADPVEAIVALIAPLAEAGEEQPENITAYQRETLFGPENLRAIGVAHGMAMPDAIEQILERHAADHPVRPGVDLRDVADAIYAMIWLEGLRVTTQGQATDARRVERLVRFLIEGLLRPGGAAS
jgi:AcrR family transcriptional regulator